MKRKKLTTILRKLELVYMQNLITPAKRDGYVGKTTENETDAGNIPIRDKNRKILGDFYEFMTAGIYGGVIRKNIAVGSAYVEPDVLNEETKQGFESKAVYTSELLKLDDHQIEKYHRLQFHMQDFDFYFAVYKHSIKRLNDYEQEHFFQGISDKTVGSIVIPLSLITQTHSLREKGFVYRYEGEKWYHTTAVRSQILNRFFGDLRTGSEKEVVEELGANPRDYTFRKLMSPMSFHIKGNRIKPFPVMFISDKSHNKWLDWFLENYQIQKEMAFGENGNEDEIPF